MQATRRQYYSRSGIALPRTDQRKPAVRRFRALVDAFETDRGGTLSVADKSLIVTAATLVIRQEALRESVVRGETVDDGELTRVSSEVRGIVGTLKARAEKSSPGGQDPLAAHLQAKYGKTIVPDEDEGDDLAEGAVAE